MGGGGAAGVLLDEELEAAALAGIADGCVGTEDGEPSS
jgi:hypothetical protein